MKSRCFLVPLLLLLGVRLAGANPVEISLQPAFIGQLDGAIETYCADVTNATSLAQKGRITVESSAGPTYPFALGPHQEGLVFLYHTFTDQGDYWSWSMKCAPVGDGQPTNAGLSERHPREIIRTRYLLVLDRSQTVVKRRHPSGDGQYECSPGRLPPRGSAYEPFNFIVVSDEAAQSVAPDAREALSEYVLAGGVVAFCSHQAAATCGFPIDQTEVAGRFGLGKAVVLDSNIFSSSAQASKNEQVLTDLLASGSGRVVMDPDAGELPVNDGRPSSARQASDPFSTSLPPFSRVATLLGLYFLAVVPCNYFLLRKVQRPELTWITAPLLAGVFAAILFGSAATLYKEKPGSATRGTFIVQEGMPDGFFTGVTDIFWGRSGVVSIRVPGGEYLDNRPGDDLQQPLRRASNVRVADMRQIPPGVTDTGDGLQWTYASRDLELTEVGVEQKIPTGGWFAFNADENGSFSVTNNSPYAISDAELHIGYACSVVRTLRPGETISVKPAVDQLDLPIGTSEVFVSRPDRVGLSGLINDLPAGVNFGKPIGQRTNIAVEVYAKDSVGQSALTSRPNLVFPVLK